MSTEQYGIDSTEQFGRAIKTGGRSEEGSLGKTKGDETLCKTSEEETLCRTREEETLGRVVLPLSTYAQTLPVALPRSAYLQKGIITGSTEKI